MTPLSKKFAVVALALVVGTALLQMATLDGIEGIVMPLAFRTNTAYAPGYSERAFRSIKTGDSAETVIARLGAPISEVWMLSPDRPGCGFVRLQGDRVVDSFREGECGLPSFAPGATKTDVQRLTGTPRHVRLLYGFSPTGVSYRERVIVLDGGRVGQRIARFYPD